jgi:hypothetical protein
MEDSPSGGRSADKQHQAIRSSLDLYSETGLTFPTGPCCSRGFTFADAEAVIAGSGGDDGDGDWAPHAYCYRRDQEVERLLPWIDAKGLWLQTESLRSGRRAGLEHFIAPLRDVEGSVCRVVKFTKGGSFGFIPVCDDASANSDLWFPLHPATPCQYLRRMALVDELQPELETRLQGFALLDGSLRIVTSQRFIEPIAATPVAITDFFSERGFQRVNESTWFHAAHGIALFDVRPANILTFEGMLYPVDIMPVRPELKMRALIQKALSS